MENLHQHIEALIFSSETALSPDDIIQSLSKTFPGTALDLAIVEQILNDIAEKYKSEIYSFEVRVIGGGYQFFTKPMYHGTVAVMIGLKEKKRLSTSAIETLSIIAYRGPVTKGECEKIRGVNCDYSFEKLLEKELIEVAGRIEGAPGKPVLYRVTQNFLDYFGINSTKELPKLKDILPSMDENTIGELNESVMDAPAETETSQLSNTEEQESEAPAEQ